MPECGQYVGSGAIAYPCIVDAGHDGPCAARENIRSIRQRDAWEAAKKAGLIPDAGAPAARAFAPVPVKRQPTHELEALGMQGPPKTTAEGLMKPDPDGQPIHRKHPAQVREDPDQAEAIENRLVSTAGAVPHAELTGLSTRNGSPVVEEAPEGSWLATLQERERNVPANEWRRWEIPPVPPTPAPEVPIAYAPVWGDVPEDYPIPGPSPASSTEGNVYLTYLGAVSAYISDLLSDRDQAAIALYELGERLEELWTAPNGTILLPQEVIDLLTNIGKCLV